MESKALAYTFRGISKSAYSDGIESHERSSRTQTRLDAHLFRFLELVEFDAGASGRTGRRQMRCTRCISRTRQSLCSPVRRAPKSRGPRRSTLDSRLCDRRPSHTVTKARGAAQATTPSRVSRERERERDTRRRGRESVRRDVSFLERRRRKTPRASHESHARVTRRSLAVPRPREGTFTLDREHDGAQVEKNVAEDIRRVHVPCAILLLLLLILILLLLLLLLRKRFFGTQGLLAAPRRRAWDHALRERVHVVQRQVPPRRTGRDRDCKEIAHAHTRTARSRLHTHTHALLIRRESIARVSRRRRRPHPHLSREELDGLCFGKGGFEFVKVICVSAGAGIDVGKAKQTDA